MSRQIAHETGGYGSKPVETGFGSVGETLPLFESGNPPTGQQRVRISSSRRSKGVPASSSASLSESLSTSSQRDKTTSVDRHMHVAWQLSKALKAVKSGRRAGRDMAKLTANQRHQVGNAICEHLLASLREQVVSEQETSTR